MKRVRLNNLQDERGESIIEIVMIIVLFSLIATGVITTLLSGTQASKQGGDYVIVHGYTQEAIEAVRSIRDQAWGAITNGAHGLTTISGKFSFFGTSEMMLSGFTRTVTIADVYRVGSLSGDIAPTGILDTNAKKVIVQIAWNAFASQVKNITSVFYVFRYATQAWVQTLAAEFNAGFQNSTITTSTSGGEVALQSASSQWNGISQLYSLDENGSGDIVATLFNVEHNWLVTLQKNTSGNDLQVLDASSVVDFAPTVLRGKDINNAFGMVVARDYAYVADNESGQGGEITIVNLLTMNTVATIQIAQNGTASSIAIYGSTLVVGRLNQSNADELYFYNVSNPISPTFLGSTNLGLSATGIAMNQQYTFIASDKDSAELTVVQTSTRQVVATLNLTTNADVISIYVRGTDVYVGRATGSSQELVKIDASNPTDELPITATLEVGSDVNGLVMDQSGTTLALATSNTTGELLVVNASDLSILQTVDVLGTSSATATAIFGTDIYLGSQANNAEVMVFGMGASGWNFPQVVGLANQSNPQAGTTITVSGSYAYVGTETDGERSEFSIYDISNPSSSVFQGSYFLNANVNRILVSGNTAYLATSDSSKELVILNVSDKSNLTLLSSVNLEGSQKANTLALVGSTLYVSRNNSSSPELYSVNILNPSSPSILDSLNLVGDILDIGVFQTRLYAASTNNSNGLIVVDISNPSFLSQVATYNITGDNNGRAISIFGSALVLGRSEGGGAELNIFNIANSTPVFLGSGDVAGDITGLSRTDNVTLQIATTQSGGEYQRWDISTLTNPTLISSANLGGSAVGVVEMGATVALATTSVNAALQIVGPLSFAQVAREGIFTSQPFDATTTVTWSSIDWIASGIGTIQFMIRTADTQANLANANWVGPDGTSNTRYTTTGTIVITDAGASGTRWVQWEAIITGDGTNSPVLQDVSLSYTQ